MFICFCFFFSQIPHIRKHFKNKICGPRWFCLSSVTSDRQVNKKITHIQPPFCKNILTLKSKKDVALEEKVESLKLNTMNSV